MRMYRGLRREGSYLILGEPDELSSSEYRYLAGDYAVFTFKIQDGKITRMIYEEVN